MSPLHPLTSREQAPVLKPEVVTAPETPDVLRETSAESKETTAVVQELPAVPQTATPTPTQETAPIVDEQLKRIEGVLSEGLEDVYRNLPLEARAPFRAKGEEVAQKIQTWMQTAKLKVRKVMHAIREWLLMIPGVNRHFLEQESKIRADRVMEMAKREDESHPL